jgi:hypothetical protein
MIRIFAAIIALTIFSSTNHLSAAEPPKEPANRQAMEKALSERLTNATLSGWYTVDGSEQQPKPDKYTLGKVFHVKGDTWHFDARMQFAGRDLTVPMRLPVLWAGDTPVISVTNFHVPGVGSYTARVVISGNRYAGTWSGATHGGTLWGRVQGPTTQPATAPTK